MLQNCKWDLNEFLQFVTVRKQKVLIQTNNRKHWCMSGRITFPKRCFKVSLGKGFDESEWYSQKEQKVMDKSFILFWASHSARSACTWHCSNDLEFHRSLLTQRNEVKELSKLEWISTHYQCQNFAVQKLMELCLRSQRQIPTEKLDSVFVAACHFLVALKPWFIVVLPGCPWKLFESEPAVTYFFPT